MNEHGKLKRTERSKKRAVKKFIAYLYCEISQRQKENNNLEPFEVILKPFMNRHSKRPKGCNAIFLWVP